MTALEAARALVKVEAKIDRLEDKRMGLLAERRRLLNVLGEEDLGSALMSSSSKERRNA